MCFENKILVFKGKCKFIEKGRVGIEIVIVFEGDF